MNHFVFLALKGQRGTDSGFNRWEQAPRCFRPEGAEEHLPPLQGASVTGRVPGDASPGCIPLPFQGKT